LAPLTSVGDYNRHMHIHRHLLKSAKGVLYSAIVEKCIIGAIGYIAADGSPLVTLSVAIGKNSISIWS
jgi:hypothetical protein